jgi:hypothetical protein
MKTDKRALRQAIVMMMLIMMVMDFLTVMMRVVKDLMSVNQNQVTNPVLK